MPTNSKLLSSALVPTGKRKEDLVEEKIDETILSLLGLTDVFDFTYEEYLSLLKEKMAAQRMQGGGDSGEAELITNEYKRVKGKTGRFKVKAKRVNVNRVVSKEKAQSVRKRSKVRLNLPKFLPRAEDTAPTSTPILLPGGENQQDNSGILNFLKNDLMSALQSINVLVSDILDNLKEQRVIDNKKAEQDRKLAEVDKKKKREEELEKKESGNKTNALVDKIKKPFTGIFDAIKNFIMMVAAGSAINFLLRVLKNPAILIKPLIDFVNSIIDFLNGIIPSIVNLIITQLNKAINFINSGLQGLIDQINNALNNIPFINDLIPSLPQIPTIDPMDPNKGLIPQVSMPQWGKKGQQGEQQLAEGGTVYGPGGTDNVNAKLTAGESVLQVGARERQIQATGIDPLAFNVGPNANKPTFKGGLPGFEGGGVVGNILDRNVVDSLPAPTPGLGGKTSPSKEDPVNAMSKSVLKGAKALPIGTMKGVGDMCAYTTREALGKGGLPASTFMNKCTSTADLDVPKGYPPSLVNKKLAGSFGGSDLGQVIKSKSSMKAGDILLWHAASGRNARKYGVGAITHVGIAGSDGLKGDKAIYDHSSRTGWRPRPFVAWGSNPLFAAVRLRPGGGGGGKAPQAEQEEKSGSGASNPLQGALKTGLSIVKKGLSMIPGMPSGAGDISFLPLPLNQGLKASTSSSGPNSTPPVVFSAHDSFSVATHAASAIYGIGS